MVPGDYDSFYTGTCSFIKVSENHEYDNYYSELAEIALQFKTTVFYMRPKKINCYVALSDRP